jgi:hypothetical protein
MEYWYWVLLIGIATGSKIMMIVRPIKYFRTPVRIESTELKIFEVAIIQLLL